jgi:hypothetical protein
VGRNDQPQEVMVVGVSFIGLFKCEDDDCGKLFIKSIDYYFPIPNAPDDQQPAAEVAITCPNGHEKVKFIQSIEKTQLTALIDDGQR